MLPASWLRIFIVSQIAIPAQTENYFAALQKDKTLLPEFDSCHTNLVVNKIVKLKPGPISISPVTLHRFSVCTKASRYWDISKVSYVQTIKHFKKVIKIKNTFSSMFRHLCSLESTLPIGEALAAG